MLVDPQHQRSPTVYSRLAMIAIAALHEQLRSDRANGFTNPEIIDIQFSPITNEDLNI